MTAQPVHFTAEQQAFIRKTSDLLQVSPAEIVRRCVDQVKGDGLRNRAMTVRAAAQRRKGKLVPRGTGRTQTAV